MPWPRLAAMLFLVVVAVTLLEWAYSSNPVPPGVDPGDWIARSGGYVGHAVPPELGFGSPFIYPPLLFPFLGALFLFLGSPLTTAFVAGGILLFVFGLSLICVAVRFLRFGPLQVGFVGATLFCGTLLSMLFWGAYPNLLAFVFLDLGLVFLLQYLRNGDRLSGLLIGGSLSLTYLTHTLTFAVDIVTVLAVAVLFLMIAGPRRLWHRIRNVGLLSGIGLLVATVIGYTLGLRWAGVVPPNYLGANPAALIIDNVGEIFVPLATAPAYFPAGAKLVLSTDTALSILVGSALALILPLFVVWKRRPDLLRMEHLVAVGALVAALLVPVGGALARIPTDYTRFLYFLPVPATLLLATVLDRAIIGIRRSHEAVRLVADRPGAGLRRIVGRDPGIATGYVAVAVVLALLFVNVSVPVAETQENLDTGPTHSELFLQAAQWIGANPAPGSVLTEQGTARWVEVLTDRDAYDTGPTWLDFETWVIVNSQASFWALNSQYAVTDNNAILSYTPTSTPVLSQDPMYSVFDEGVIFPVARVLPGALSVTLDTPTGVEVVTGKAWGLGELTIDPTTGVGTICYTTPQFDATLTGALGGNGTSGVTLTLDASAGSTLESVNVTLGSPPANVALLHGPTGQNVSLTPSGFLWTSTGTLGQFPNPAVLTTTGTFDPAPSSSSLSDFPANTTLTSQFLVPPGSGSFNVSLELSTPGTGNPGVSLPLILNTSAFLATHDIHFLFLPTALSFAATITLYQQVFGFTTAYLNSQWEVLED